MPADAATLLSGIGGRLLAGNNAGSVLFSNQSNAGIFNNWQQDMARATGSALADEIANNVRRQTLTHAYMAIRPGSEPAQAANFANNIMGKWGFGTVYGMLDSALGLDYSADIGNYTGQMAAAQAMNMLRSGNGPKSFWFADSLARNFFGDRAYNAAEFGGLSQRGAAMVAARLGEHMDLSRFVDPGRNIEAQGKDAADRLKEAVKRCGQAMEPLKDVFGDDIPAMIDAIEQLTGKALGATSTRRIADVAEKIADAALAGNYTVQQASATTAMINRALSSQQGLSLNHYTMAPALADATLNMQLGNTAPSYMTDAQYANMAADIATRRAQLKAGDTFVKAFVLWRSNMRRRGMEGTQDQFIAAMNRMGGVNTRNAIMLSGAGPMGLDAAYQDPEYNDLVASGFGGEMARHQLAASKVSMLARGNMYNPLVRGTLGLSARGAVRATNMMAAALRSNGELLNMEDLGTMTRTLVGMGMSAGDANIVARLISINRNDPRTNGWMAELQALNAEDVSRARAQSARELRGTLSSVDTLIMDPNKGLNTISSDRWTAEGISTWLNGSQSIIKAAPRWRAYTNSAVSAGLLAADMSTEGPQTTNKESAEYKEWENERASRGRRMVNYALTQSGLTNATFQRAMHDFNMAKTDDERRVLADVMYAASSEGLSASVAEFLGDTSDYRKYNARRQLLSRLVRQSTFRGQVDALKAADAGNAATYAGLYAEIESTAGGLDGNADNKITDEERIKAIDQLIAAEKEQRKNGGGTKGRLESLQRMRYAASAANVGLREQLRVANYKQSVQDLINDQVGQEQDEYSKLATEVRDRAVGVDNDTTDFTTTQDRVTAIRQMIKDEKSKDGGGNEERIRRLEELEKRAVSAAKSTAEPFNLGSMLTDILGVLNKIFTSMPAKPSDGEPSPPTPPRPNDAAGDDYFSWPK